MSRVTGRRRVASTNNIATEGKLAEVRKQVTYESKKAIGIHVQDIIQGLLLQRQALQLDTLETREYINDRVDGLVECERQGCQRLEVGGPT